MSARRRLGRGLTVKVWSGPANPKWGGSGGHAEPPLLKGAVASLLKPITAIGTVVPAWTHPLISSEKPEIWV